MIAPFPYFGGKRRVSDVVWRAFGDAQNYVEPFAGSLAVLLARPHDYTDRIETVNDADGFIANFWRAVRYAPDEVARWADWPVNEADLHARHVWLLGQRERITERLMGDPDYYDAKIAGWWVWGICSWIGAGWCAGNGSWTSVDGVLTKMDTLGGAKKSMPHLGDAGRGIHRQMPHLGDAGQGIHRQRPHLGNAGQGIHRQMPETAAQPGQCAAWRDHLRAMMDELADRLRRVRVCCGDWQRVCGPSPTTALGITGVFLDPPYSAEAGRYGALYSVDDLSVAHDVRTWAIANGANPRMRIALCGYASEHAADMPADWTVYEWETSGGYGNQSDNTGRANKVREVIWFSPHCLPLEPETPQQMALLWNDLEADT